MKILWLSDTPAVPSGYGVQTRLVLRGLQALGHETFCLGGALTHPALQPYIFEGTKVLPVQGYGTGANVREVFRAVKPDVMVVCPDPRFLPHVWHLENEIRQQCPLIYWHIWDNEPYPEYNNSIYDSCTAIASASLFTQELLAAKGRGSTYIPLAVDSTVYAPMPEKEVQRLRAERGDSDTFWVTSVNRNAGRKRVVDLLTIFKKFHSLVPKARLLLHTDPEDTEGPSLWKAIELVGLPDGVVQLSVPRGQPASYVNQMYNIGHVHVSISMNEGVGVTVAEAMAAGRPNIVTATGGMAELVAGTPKPIGPAQGNRVQAYDRGWLVHAAVRAFGGANGGTPYIYQDWVGDDDVVQALEEAHARWQTGELAAMGRAARAAIVEEHSLNRIAQQWHAFVTTVCAVSKPPARYTVTPVTETKEVAHA